MGYVLHITRQENWLDKNRLLQIPFEEWVAYVEQDPDMRLDNFAEATLPDGTVIRTESDGLSVWTKYSSDGVNGNHAWFSYDGGSIDVKNPDDEIISKMLEIAEYMKAKVQGDDGEVYTRSADGHIIHSGLELVRISSRPWWKFW